MITAGIDVGSTTTKAVFLNGDTVLGRIIIPSGSLPAQSARDVFDQCCTESGINPAEIEGKAGLNDRISKESLRPDTVAGWPISGI